MSTDFFKGKYRVPSTRLQSWDYSSNGCYFITICTKNKNNFFGEIVKKKMVLNKIGNIAQKCWLEIPEHFNFVRLDKFIIMPNHVHGLLIIQKENNNFNTKKDCFQNQGKNTISSIIGSYKSACTKLINRMGNNFLFAWQPRFYDRIVFNEKEFNNIRQYIIDNPLKWELDENNLG